MKLNICSQELFSSNASNPSFRDENKDPFLPDLQKYSLSKLCLRQHCYYQSLPARHHQCLVLRGEICLLLQEGTVGEKGGQRQHPREDLIGIWAARRAGAQDGFCGHSGRSYNDIKVFKK